MRVCALCVKALTAPSRARSLVGRLHAAHRLLEEEGGTHRSLFGRRGFCRRPMYPAAREATKDGRTEEDVSKFRPQAQCGPPVVNRPPTR